MLEPLKPDLLRNINIDPVLLFLLKKLVDIIPRGKGFLPRSVGKLFSSYLNKCALLTRHGAKLKIDPASLDFYTTMLDQNRSFDYWVFDTCRSFIKPDDVFYDIGANVGYMSVEMAKCEDQSMQIYAFEAQADLAHNVASSAQLNNFENIAVFNCALSDEVGKIQFVQEAHSIHGHIDKSNSNGSNATTVDAYTIDYLVERNIIRPPDVVKIDVEGAEHKVLLGMQEVIKQYKPVIVFEISKDTYDFDTSPKLIIEYLSSLAAYQFYWAAGSYRKQQALTEDDLAKSYVENKNILCYVN